MSVLNGMSEPIRCRATYSPSGESRLRFRIVCASEGFKIDVASDLVREGSRLSGDWHETTFNVSGNVSGTVAGDRITAVVNGGGFRANLGLALRGGVQNVSLTSEGQIAGSATVTLRRE